MKEERIVDFVSWIVSQVFGVVMGFVVGYDYGKTAGLLSAALIILLSDIRYDLTKIVLLTKNNDRR